MSTKPAFDIRLADPSDPAISYIGTYAFEDSPAEPKPVDQEKSTRYRRQSKTWHSYVDDHALAQVAVHPMTMNLRGQVFPMGGVGGVATMPLGRRGGHVRALMQHALEQMREDGQALSALYPFRESFYERFGYTGLSSPEFVQFDPRHLSPVMKIEKTGNITFQSIRDGADRWFAFLREFQKQCNAFSIDCDARHEAIIDENSWWLVTVEENGTTTGAMIYKIESERSQMISPSMLWLTVNAQYQLLDFIARHVDQIQTVRMGISPGCQPNQWLTDTRIMLTCDDELSWGLPMARVVSLDQISDIDGGTGSVVLDITDDACPWNAGVWTFSAANGHLTVTPGGKPQAALGIQAINALLFMGMDPALFTYRGWGTVDEETAVALRTLFPQVHDYVRAQF